MPHVSGRGRGEAAIRLPPGGAASSPGHRSAGRGPRVRGSLARVADARGCERPRRQGSRPLVHVEAVRRIIAKAGGTENAEPLLAVLGGRVEQPPPPARATAQVGESQHHPMRSRLLARPAASRPAPAVSPRSRARRRTPPRWRRPIEELRRVRGQDGDRPRSARDRLRRGDGDDLRGYSGERRVRSTAARPLRRRNAAALGARREPVPPARAHEASAAACSAPARDSPG